MRRAALLKIGFALAAAGLAGTPRSGGQAPSTARPAAAEEKSPLGHEIHHELLSLPYYSPFDNIAFTLRGATVTLTGQVVRPTLKTDAELSVKTIAGVSTVVNQIELLPVSPSDDDLRRSIYRAIYENPRLARYAVQTVPSIRIIVKYGSVALEGTVGSAEDRNLAASRAASVANVRGVTNNLIVLERSSAGQ